MSDADLLWKIIALLAITGNVFLIIKKLIGKPESQTIANSPLVVQEHQEFISRRECSLHHETFNARLVTLERRFELHQDGIKSEIADLHEKMNDHHGEVMRAIGRLEGKS